MKVDIAARSLLQYFIRLGPGSKKEDTVVRYPNLVEHHFVNVQQLLLQVIDIIYDLLWSFIWRAE